MYIKRFLEGELYNYLDKREIIAVIGPRQCGKTTLLKQIQTKLENSEFIDLEDREILELFTEDIKSFAKIYIEKNKYLFIDEFQYAKDGGKNLKYLFDNYNCKIIISGSSVTELSIQSIKYLVGRIFVFNLYPFSFEEFLAYKDKNLFELYQNKKVSAPISRKIYSLYKEFCVYGGYPRVILSEERKEKEVVIRNIYNTYFLKEVKEILNLKQDYKLSKLIQALSIQAANIVNYNELSDLTGFSHQDLLDHLNILCKTFICSQARPFYRNKRTELVKSPKIFFIDNGFRNLIIKNFTDLDKRQDNGQLNENFIASEMIKNADDLKYWRTKSKAEVDFILERGGQIIPIESKSLLKTPKLTKSFLSFVKKYKPEKGFILSNHLFSEKKILEKNIYFRPAFMVGKIINQ